MAVAELNPQDWVGRSESREDFATPSAASRLAALLDYETAPWPAETLPPLGHWLYFLSHARQSQLDVDGHPYRGGLLPPIGLPRRMWAGSRIEFLQPAPLNAEIRQVSTIRHISEKSGRSGALVFVTVQHEVFCGNAACIREEQDLVYREEAKADGQPSAASSAAPPIVLDYPLQRTVQPDSRMLFRFSALTFNGHRIHYDRPYATEIEGYPDLVVHGPLTAMLLTDQALRAMPGRRLRSIAFRALAPAICDRPLRLCSTVGQQIGNLALAAYDDMGRHIMTADAAFASD